MNITSIILMIKSYVQKKSTPKGQKGVAGMGILPEMFEWFLTPLLVWCYLSLISATSRYFTYTTTVSQTDGHWVIHVPQSAKLIVSRRSDILGLIFAWSEISCREIVLKVSTVNIDDYMCLLHGVWSLVTVTTDDVCIVMSVIYVLSYLEILNTELEMNIF